MKKLIGLLFIILPIATFSQQLVNGFSVEVYTGKTYYDSDPKLKIKYNNNDFQAGITDSETFGGSVYFPFDIGVNRHRFVIAPGFEYQTRDLFVDFGGREFVGNDGSIKNNVSLQSTTYSPFALLMYKPHFYIGKLHLSFGIGASIKYQVANTVELCDDNNAALIKYNADWTENDEEFINFNGNVSAEVLAQKGLSIAPRIGLDAYFGNSFMISIFASVQDITNFSEFSNQIPLTYGAGISYLIRTHKVTEAQILQQYKK